LRFALALCCMDCVWLQNPGSLKTRRSVDFDIAETAGALQADCWAPPL
jgi:hypothetical protein